MGWDKVKNTPNSDGRKAGFYHRQKRLEYPSTGPERRRLTSASRITAPR